MFRCHQDSVKIDHYDLDFLLAMEALNFFIINKTFMFRPNNVYICISSH